MHLELPQGALDSAKDFARHFVMIVISILTALGLEAWIEHTHHQHAAESARMRIDAEVRLNLQDIRRIRAHDVERTAELNRLRDVLVTDIKADAPQATIEQHVRDNASDGIFLDVRWPTLRHAAWDVAVADQSAGWMDSSRLGEYSSVYALQQRADALIGQEETMVLNGPRMFDALVDLKTGSLQPRELLHVVAQMAALLDETSKILDSLDKRIAEGLPDVADGRLTAAPRSAVPAA